MLNLTGKQSIILGIVIMVGLTIYGVWSDPVWFNRID